MHQYDMVRLNMPINDVPAALRIAEKDPIQEGDIQILLVQSEGSKFFRVVRTTVPAMEEAFPLVSEHISKVLDMAMSIPAETRDGIRFHKWTVIQTQDPDLHPHQNGIKTAQFARRDGVYPALYPRIMWIQGQKAVHLDGADQLGGGIVHEMLQDNRTVEMILMTMGDRYDVDVIERGLGSPHLAHQ